MKIRKQNTVGTPLLLRQQQRQKRRLRTGTRGFMLADALIAVVIGALLTLSAVTVLSAASRAANSARQSVVAYNAARQVIENLRVFKASRLIDGTYGPYTNRETPFGLVPQLGAVGQSAATRPLNAGTVSFTVSTRRNNLRSVRVTVTYNTDVPVKTVTRVLPALLVPDGVAP